MESVGQIETSPDLFEAVSKGARSRETSGLTQSEPLTTPASSIEPFFIEFKTYTAGFINKFHHIIQSHETYIEVDLGCSDINDEPADLRGLDTFQRAANNLLSQVVPDPSYRYQVFHHSAVFGSDVMYVTSFPTEIVYV